MFTYRYEYCGNPEYVELHVSVKLTDSKFVNPSVKGTEEDSEMLATLHGSLGVVEASIRPYSVTATIGGAFEREEVLDDLLETVKMILSMRGEDMTESKKLETRRGDILGMRCPECKRIQDEEMRKAMADMDKMF